MEIVSLLTISCILIAFVVLFFLLPQKLLSYSIETSFINKIFSNIIYASLVVILAGNLLPRFNLFNWLTLILCYFIWPTLYWTGKNLKQLNSLLRTYLINKYLQLLDLLEFDNLSKAFNQYLVDKKQIFFSLLKKYIIKIDFSNPLSILSIVFFAITITFIVTLNLSQPLENLRLPFTESYQTLLQSWQILLGTINSKEIILLPSIVAAISTLAATDPLQTARFFSPILLCLFTFLLGATVWRMTGYKSIGLIAIYFLGTNIFYWPKDNSFNKNHLSESLLDIIYSTFQQALSQPLFGGENVLACVFLLLAINFWNELVKEGRGVNFKKTLANTLISLTLIGLSSPLLLLPAFLTMIVLVLLPSIGLLILSVSLITLILFVEINQARFSTVLDLKFVLPIAITLFCTAFCQFLVYYIKFMANRYGELIVIVLAVATTVSFLPKQPRFQYLEYNISAKKTLQITQQFPKKQWLVVAPVEQLAISYGYGWYEDLATFVNKYQEEVKDAQFNFSYPLDIFIFVEKKPFVIFDQEPKYVPFSTLNDLTYKNYRSPAGRASLEQQAITLCENYRQLHPEVKVYYEDDVLRIYFIPKKDR